MIKIVLGQMGSGKTLSTVRQMILNEDDKIIFSNIQIKGNQKHCIQINREMIIKKEVIGYDSKGNPKTQLKLNSEFWKEAREKYKSLTVVIDEAHTILDSRRSMSKDNKILNDFIALLRRILGDAEGSYGELILITQLGRRLDIIAKQLSTMIVYNKLHYKRRCKTCGFSFNENNEQSLKYKVCPKCAYNKFEKYAFIIEIWEFATIDHFDAWKENKLKSYHSHYYLKNVEHYFKYYNTFQWDNLISEY